MPVKHVIDILDKSAIIAAYEENCSFSEMEDRFDICSPTLRKYLREWGVYKDKTRTGSRKPGRITFSEEEKAIIIGMYRRGESIPKIAGHVRVRPITLSSFLKAEGLFQARRNKDYKLGITDEQIRETFDKTGSIRTTCRELGGLNQRFVKATLLRLGVEDSTHHEIYARIEEYKDEIIDLYKKDDMFLPDVAKKFGISKHILRTSLKRWGAYNAKKRPASTLIKAGISKDTIIETYNTLRSTDATAQRLGVSSPFVLKILKRAKINLFSFQKSRLIEKDKEVIIRRYSELHDSCPSIAKDYEVWSTTILDALKRWGVKITNYKNKVTQETLNANKDKICDLYKNKAYSLREIATEVGIGHGALIRAVKRWGISVPDNRFRESSLERQFKKLLIKHGISFKQYQQVVNRIYDFYLPDFNLIVECNGDYWHGNPLVFPNPNEEQVKGQQRDIYKNALARKAGYAIYFIWEFEVNNAPDMVDALLRKLVAGEKPVEQSSPIDFLTEHPEIVNSSSSLLTLPLSL